MIFDLFFKKRKQVNEIKTSVISTNYLKVINASEIEDMDKPPFNQSKWGKEEEYREFLESVQPLIEEFERTGKIHSLEYNSFDDIEKNREEQNQLNIFNNSFMDAGQWIDVRKSLSGNYQVDANGRHRMYVAKKYGLKLLVHVSQEVICPENH